MFDLCQLIVIDHLLECLLVCLPFRKEHAIRLANEKNLDKGTIRR